MSACACSAMIIVFLSPAWRRCGPFAGAGRFRPWVLGLWVLGLWGSACAIDDHGDAQSGLPKDRIMTLSWRIAAQ